MKINDKVMEMVNDFSKLEEVEGILLAGSQATKTNDSDSDYDIYIYISKGIPVQNRKKITDKYCSYMELNNTFWETEDDGYIKEGNIPVEIIYRDLAWTSDLLNTTIVKCKADVGYTTCFWSNLVNSIILYDKNGDLNKLQDKYKINYPYELKQNIVKKNYPLLKLQMPSYYYQIQKALKRDDSISINHRVAAFFASYFDILFAINEFPHPGEKKIFKIMKENNFKIPADMETNVNNILKHASLNDSIILSEIDSLIGNLDTLLKHEDLYLFNNAVPLPL